jgi:hypothetical protein
MEPTGIEPVTSCLQGARSGTDLVLKGADLQRTRRPTNASDFGWMPTDYARLSAFQALLATSAWAKSKVRAPGWSRL